MKSLFMDNVTIAIVSSNTSLLRLLQPLLEGQGYSTCIYTDRRLAVHAIKNNPPNIAIVSEDIDERGKGSFVMQVYSESILQSLPVIFLVSTSHYPDWVWSLPSTIGRQLMFNTLTLPLGRGELENCLRIILNTQLRGPKDMNISNSSDPAKAVLEQLIRLFPNFQEQWNDEENYHMGDDGAFTVHAVFSEFSDYVRDHFSKMSAADRRALFTFVEDCISNRDGDDVDNAVCTCFLENLSDEEILTQIKPYLLPKSMDFINAWLA